MDVKLESSHFGIQLFLSTFGWVYLWNHKRERKSVNVIPKVLDLINSKNKKFSTWSIQRIKVLDLINSKNKKLHQNWMNNKNSIYLPNMRNFWIWAPFRPLYEIKTNNGPIWWPHTVEFISKNVGNRGSLSAWYQKLGQHIQFKEKNCIKIGWKIQILYHPNMQNSRNKTSKYFCLPSNGSITHGVLRWL